MLVLEESSRSLRESQVLTIIEKIHKHIGAAADMCNGELFHDERGQECTAHLLQLVSRHHHHGNTPSAHIPHATVAQIQFPQRVPLATRCQRREGAGARVGRDGGTEDDFSGGFVL